MKIQNKFLEAVAVTIESFQINDKGETVKTQGLVTENISLGLKRRLKKIKKDILSHYSQFQEDLKDLDKESETYQKDLEELMSEEVEINQEYVSLQMIEEIETTVNYDFDIIELFAK